LGGGMKPGGPGGAPDAPGGAPGKAGGGGATGKPWEGDPVGGRKPPGW
jgi:hypothetical protein